MSTSQISNTVSVIAGAAVGIYRFVQLQTDGKFDQVGTAQARMDGISAGAAAADLDVIPMVVPDGRVAKVEAGATVTAGMVAASDNVGRCIEAVSTAGNVEAGMILSGGAVGEIIQILFRVDRDQA